MVMSYSVDINDFPHLVREYSKYKAVIAGSAEKTVTEYLLDLRTFFRYLYAKKNGLGFDDDTLESIDISSLSDSFILEVNTEDIFDFLYYADTVRDNKWSAKSRKLSAIKGFYKYLVQKVKLIEVNPAANIESPKRKQQLPKVLTFDESVSLLDAVKNDELSKHRERDYAIITLFLNCGMRLSELCGIGIYDIDSELRSLRVIGKGSKERIVYLNGACKSALEAYLKIRLAEPLKSAKTDKLFLSQRLTQISNKTVQYIVYKYLDAAGLEHKHYSVHKLRHTAATLMYQSGNVDVRVLKDILGHEQLNTTQIYTHVSDVHMENAMEQNPLASIKSEKK